MTDYTKLSHQLEVFWWICRDNNIINNSENRVLYFNMIDEGMDEQTMAEVFKL